MHIIASIDIDDDLARFYEIHWAPLPNLAMDLLLPGLIRYFDIYIVGKTFLAIVLIVIATGMWAVNLAIFRSPSMGPILALPFLYNVTFILGMLNYLLGVGLSLWAFAGWIMIRDYDWRLRLLLSTASVVVLFFCHLFAVAIYMLLLSCFEIWIFSRRPKIFGNLARDGGAVIMPMALVLALMLFTPTTELVTWAVWTSWKAKLTNIAWVWPPYYPIIDGALSLLVGAVAIWGLVRRRFHLHPVGWLVFVAGVLTYLCLPNTLFGSLHTDSRFSVAVLFGVLALSRWDAHAVLRRGVLAVLVAVISIRLALTSMMWLHFDSIYSEFRDALHELPRGRTLLVAREEPARPLYNRAWPLNHMGCLAIIESSAFVPNAFTRSGAQILSVTDAYRMIDMDRNALVPKLDEILFAARNSEAPELVGRHFAQWTEDFDFLLLLYPRSQPRNPLPEILSPVHSGRAFTIYRIGP